MFTSLFFGVLAAATGVWLLIRQGSEYRRAWESRRWPTYEAVILHATMHVVALGGAGVGGPRLGAAWDLRYAYEVPDRYARRGHAREGHRFRFGPVPLRTVSAFLRAHPVGTVVPVAVNPRNFDDAVLKPGPTALGTLAFLGGVAGCVAGLVWLRFALLAATT